MTCTVKVGWIAINICLLKYVLINKNNIAYTQEVGPLIINVLIVNCQLSNIQGAPNWLTVTDVCIYIVIEFAFKILKNQKLFNKFWDI